MPLRNVAEYLERSAARVPDKTAFSDAAGAVSYRQMLHDAQALGTVLAGLPRLQECAGGRHDRPDCGERHRHAGRAAERLLLCPHRRADA